MHSALTDSVAAQSQKLAETSSGAQTARNDAKLARSQVPRSNLVPVAVSQSLHLQSAAWYGEAAM